MTEWTTTPPVAAGRFWKLAKHSCGKCWCAPRIVTVIRKNAPISGLGSYERDNLLLDDTRIDPLTNPDVMWSGPLGEDVPPPLPAGWSS